VEVLALKVSALSDVNVTPVAAEAVVRNDPAAVIALGDGFVSFGSPSATKNDVLVAVVTSVIVTVIS